MKYIVHALVTFVILMCSITNTSSAAQKDTGYELMPYIGFVYGNDIEDSVGDDLDVSNDPSIGLAFSWYDTPTGKGQVLVNYVSHEFDNSLTDNTEDLNILYTHFSGIRFMELGQLTTTAEIGIGAAYIDTDFESGVYPSITLAAGIRYDISNTFAIHTDIRGYGTITDDDGDFFCKNSTCVADFGSGVYYDASLNVGFAFDF